MNKMKKSILKIMLAASTIAVLISSCSEEPAKSNTDKVITEAKSDADKVRQMEIEQYKKESREKIIANEKIIVDLKARVNMSKQDARDNYNYRIEVLEKRNNELKVKLEAFQEMSEAGWNNFKTEFNHDMQELGDAFEDFTKNNVK